ncbi:DUF3846 domain-containing protein [Bacillaceae bacterium IKA-2]|nr:DUF3846 domain-containing protein [Bacillaceae bacterium IKA-2]
MEVLTPVGLRIVLVEVGKKPIEYKTIRSHAGDDDEMRNTVGGWLKCIKLPHNIDLWINEEGMYEGFDINFFTATVEEETGAIKLVDEIRGNAFFASHDEGDFTVSLSDKQVARVMNIFRSDRKIVLI